MNQQLLHERFEYKDGNLIYKIRCGTQGNVGDVAGFPHHTGYTVIGINKKTHPAHRLIYIYHNGEIPEGMQIDHINRVKNDNHIENLRLATRSQNGFNRPKNKNNISGFKGVTYHKHQKKWLAKTRINGKVKHLGYYPTPELASAAYKAAANTHHKHFANY